jgi:hypothetical protein
MPPRDHIVPLKPHPHLPDPPLPRAAPVGRGQKLDALVEALRTRPHLQAVSTRQLAADPALTGGLKASHALWGQAKREVFGE